MIGNRLDITSIFKDQLHHDLDTSVQERQKKLSLIKKFITDTQNTLKLSEALKSDLTKPEMEIAVTEIEPVLNNLKFIQSNLRSWMAEQKVAGHGVLTLGLKSYVLYEPKGVVCILSPWNYPFHLTLIPLLYAIAAGNSVIIKPSEVSKNTTEFIDEMISTLFDPAEVAVVQGGPEVAEVLTSLPFDHIYFTGSSQNGKKVMKAASENLTSVTLELGGKTPAIVDKDVKVRSAATKLAWAKCMNAGQTCIAPDYLLLHQAIEEDFISAFKDVMKKMYGEDIFSSSDYGRIINHHHFDRLESILADAKQNGARIIYGKHIDKESLFFPPILITDVTMKMRVMEEEIFGPILPVIQWDEPEEALSIINTLRKPLSFYILSNNQASCEYFINNTSAGSTVVNDLMLSTTNPHLPFGGAGRSGMGRSYGLASFVEFSNARSIVKRKWGTFRPFYPPYNKTKINWARKLYRWS